jgi:hypothetical protein
MIGTYSLLRRVCIGVVISGLCLGLAFVVFHRLTFRPGAPLVQPQPRTSSEQAGTTPLPTNFVNTERRSAGAVAALGAPASERLAFLLGTRGDGLYETRFAALRQLSPELSESNLQLLLDFLVEPQPSNSLTSGQSHALKNDILNLLRTRPEYQERLARVLIGLSSDQAQPLTMRDYALQHLSDLDFKKNPQLRQPVENTLWAASQGSKDSIPGTALLALHRFSQEPGNFDTQRLRQQSSSLRATALQISSLLEDSRSLSLALPLAQDRKSPPQLRASSIAVVGQLGNKTHLPALQTWAQSPEPSLSVPAQHALTRLNQRLGL